MKLRTWLVAINSPLRTLRGKGRTRRKVRTRGGGSRKLTRNLHPAGRDHLGLSVIQRLPLTPGYVAWP